MEIQDQRWRCKTIKLEMGHFVVGRFTVVNVIIVGRVGRVGRVVSVVSVKSGTLRCETLRCGMFHCGNCYNCWKGYSKDPL